MRCRIKAQLLNDKGDYKEALALLDRISKFRRTDGRNSSGQSSSSSSAVYQKPSGCSDRLGARP